MDFRLSSPNHVHWVPLRVATRWSVLAVLAVALVAFSITSPARAALGSPVDEYNRSNTSDVGTAVVADPSPFDRERGSLDGAPSNLSLDAPDNPVVRASDGSNGGKTTLEVTYSYDDAEPDTSWISLKDGNGNAVKYGFDDSGQGSTVSRTVTLDLAAPSNTNGVGETKIEGNGLTNGNSYDVRIDAVDELGNGTFIDDNENWVAIDNTAPSITGVTKTTTDGLYGIGGTITVEVNYDETVIVDGTTPAIDLDVGGSTKQATYLSGSGSSTLTFTYQIQEGDSDPGGISFVSKPLDGGTIVDDGSRNNAGRDFSGQAPDVSGVRVDGIHASNLSVDSPTVDTTFKQTSQTLDITYSYDEPRPRDVSIRLVDSDGGQVDARFDFDDSGESGSVNKTVTLDLSAPDSNSVVPGTTYELRVTAIDKATNDTTVTAQELLTIDNTLPTVTQITRLSPTNEITDASSVTFQVTFSEIVESIGTDDFAIGDSPSGSASISGVSPNLTADQGWQAEVTVSSISDDGTLGLDVANGNAQDRAGNGLDATEPSTDETYSINQNAPTITSVTTLDRDNDGNVDAADVIFSEPIDDSEITPGDYTLGGASPEGKSTTVGGDSETDDEKIQLQINTDADEVAGTDVKELTYTQGTTADLAGNLLADVDPGNVSETDGAPPVLTLVETGASLSELSVTFSEPVWSETGQTDPLSAGDFTFTDDTGGGVSISSVEDPTAGDNTATVNLGGNAEPGADKLAAALNEIYDQADNAAPTIDEVVEDGTGPSLSSAVTADTDGDGTVDEITVTFTEAVDDGTVEAGDFNLSNPSGSIENVDTGTNSDDDTTTLIVSGLGTKNTAVTPDVGLPGSVDDTEGNTGPPVSPSTVESSDGAPPVVTSATTLDRDNDGKIDAADVVFTEPIDDGTPTASNYAIDGTEVEAIDTKSTSDDDTIQLRITTDANEVDGTEAKQVSYSPGSTADLNGNDLGGFDRTATDGAQPTITDLEILDTNADGFIDEIGVTFSETIDTDDSSAPTASDFDTITLPDGSTADLSPASFTNPDGGSATVTISNVTGQSTAETAAGNTGISGDVSANWRDGNGNNLVATLDDESVIDSAAPVPLTAEATSGKAAVTVTFSEGVYANSGGSGALQGTDFSYSDNSGDGASAVSSVESHSAGNDVATVALNAGVQSSDLGNDVIGSNDIYDTAGNAANGDAPLQDTQPPSNPVSTSGGTITAANAGSYSVDVTLVSSHEAGTVEVKLEDGEGNSTTASTPVPADTDGNGDQETITVSGVDASGLNDGTDNVTITARITDFAGQTNGSGFTASSTTSKDTQGPTGTMNLVATAVADGNINLNWDDINDGTTTYSLRRSTSSGGPFSEVTTVSDNDSGYSYTDDGSGNLSAPSDGQTYYYVVVPIDGVGNEGPQSNEANATADAAAPTITDGTLAGDNAYVDVTFSEGVYTGSDGTGALTASDLTYSFNPNGGSASDISIDNVEKTNGNPLAGGETTVRVQISVSGAPASGDETVAIQPASGTAIYDGAGNAMGSSQSTGTLTLNDRKPPTITDGTPAEDNSSVTVSFSEGTYANSGGTDPLTTDDLSASFTQNGGAADGVSITGVTKTDGTTSLSGGESTIQVQIDVSGAPASGVETVAIEPANGSSIYDGAGNTMGSGQTTGDLPLNDRKPPTIASATTLDRDDDGRVDAADISFSEPIDDNLLTASNYAIGGTAAASFVTGTTADDAKIQLQITLDGGNEVDGTETKDVTYTPGSTADLAGNELATVADGDVSETDGAAPVIRSATTADGNSNGQIDAIDLQYSESVDVTDGSTSDGLPGYSVDGYTIEDTDYGASGTTGLTLQLQESGTPDTDVTPTVNYTQADGNNPTVADPASNEQVDGDSETPADAAAPIGTMDPVATAKSGGDIALTWTDIDETATYSLRRSTSSGGGYSEVTTVSDDNSSDYSYTDPGSGISDGTTYYYVVVPVDGASNAGPMSSEASATSDATAPTSPALAAPADSTFKQTTQTLDVSYSYSEARPDSVTISFADGSGNTAAFGIDDSGYAADGSEKTVTLDLSDPKTGGLTTETTYDLTVTAADVAGNIEATTVAERLTVDNTAPQLQAATIAADSLFLDYDDILDGGSVPAVGDFTVTVSGSSVSLASTVIRNDTAAVELSSEILAGDDVTVDYTPGSSPIRDRAQNEAAALSGRAVTNNTEDTTPPTISSISDQTIDEDNTTGTLSFTVGDNLSAASDLIVSATSSNQDLVPDANLALGGTGTDRTIEATPEPDSNGTAEITVTVEDEKGLTASTSFTLTVNAVNDTPTITTIDDQTIDEDNTTGALSVSVSDVETSASDLVLSASSSNQDLVPDANLALGGSGENRTVEATPAPDSNGTAQITVQVEDGNQETASTTFTLTVNAVNDAPTITAITDTTINEDQSTGTRAFTIGDVETETSALTLSANSDNQDVVPDDSLALGGSGKNRTITATPTADSNGTATITVIADDGGKQTSETYLLTVDPVNDAPVVVTNEPLPVRKGALQSIEPQDLTTDDVESPPSELVYSVLSSNRLSQGRLLVNGTQATSFTQKQINEGAVQYEHTSTTTQDDNFDFTVTDQGGSGLAASGTFEITITTNSPPTARADTFATDEDETLVIADSANGLLANDSDPDRDELQASIVSNPSNGDLTLNGDGTFSYAPTTNFNGTDGFDYRVGDGAGGADTAAVALTIRAVNDTPAVATNDGLILDEGTSKTLPASVLSVSDPDDDASALTYTVESVPSNGTLRQDGTALSDGDTFTQANLDAGVISYAHDGSETTSDRFDFSVADDDGAATGTTSFSISISLINASPVASDDAYTTDEDETLAVADAANGLFANDSDPDGDALQASIVSNPSNGTLTLDGDGTFTYEPATNFNGSDRFTYRAGDGAGGADTAAVDLTIRAVNDTPAVAVNDTLSLDEAATTTIQQSLLSASDVESGLADLTYQLTTAPTNGTLTVSGDTLDVDGTFTQADINDGVFTYAHNGSETTNDRFDVVVTDQNGLSTDTARVPVNVTPVNDTPVLTTNAGRTVAEGADSLLTTQQLRVTDAESGPADLTYRITTAPANGTLSLDGAPLNAGGTFTQADVNDSTLVYAHDGSETTSDRIDFVVTDGGGATTNTKTFSISVISVNEAPTLATNAGITLDEGRSKAITTADLRATDPDDGTSNLTYTITSSPTQGQILVNGEVASSFTQRQIEERVVQYKHTADTPDDDQFTFDLTDDRGAGPTGRTFAITVRMVNIPPTASDDEYVVKQGQTLSVADSTNGVLGNDSDDDGHPLDATLVNGPAKGSVTLNPNGTFEYTPKRSFDGTDAFTYEATDGFGGASQATVDIQVRPDQTTVTTTRTFPDPTEQRSFRLIGAPGAVNTPLASTLSGEQGDDWKAFRENGLNNAQSASRAECGDGTSCRLRPGTGFWLVSRSSWAVADSFQTVSLSPGPSPNSPVYRVPLQDGWNIISNPVEKDVSWSAVQAASGTNQPLWRWDGSWKKTGTLASATSGTAYYFMDDDIDELVLPFPSLSPRRQTAASAKDAATDSTLALHVVEEGDTVSTARVGLRRHAEPGLDRTDRFAPPGYFATAALRLVERDGKRTYTLASEHAPPGREGYAFDLRLRAPSNTALDVVPSGTDAFANKEIALVRQSNGRSHALEGDSAFTVVSRSSTNRFRLLVGSEQYVEEQKRAIAPSTVKMLPNYPNPFDEATTLEYALPERQQVRIAIYDVMGRRVRVLVDEQQRAGFHQVQWRVGGGSIASGVYFARLRTEDATKVERIVVVH